jgi:hypothetical protein
MPNEPVPATFTPPPVKPAGYVPPRRTENWDEGQQPRFLKVLETQDQAER